MAMETTTTRQPQAPWRIGVDVGGAFTDLVLADTTEAIYQLSLRKLHDPGMRMSS